MKAAEYTTLRACEDHHWWYATLRHLALTALRRHVKEGAHVLDAGCGTGGMMALLDRWQVKGVDASEVAIRHCRERGLREVKVASVNAMPFPDAMFDAALCLDVLYHGGVQPDRALSELARVVKPGGVVIFNHAAFDVLRGTHDEAVEGARRYSAARAGAELGRHRFAVESMHYWNAWLFLPVLLWRRWSTGRASDVKLPHPLLNRCLVWLGRLDAWLCRAVRLPVGTSLFVVARRQETSATTSSR